MAINKNKVLAAAQKLMQRGAYDKAIREYQKLIEEDPKDVRSLLKVGDLYAKKGNAVEAVKTYERVAQTYSEQGFYSKASAVYKQILKVDPGQVEVNRKLAEISQQMGLLSDAIAQYHALAGQYERLGRSADTIAVFKKVVELDPENVASRVKLAELYSRESMNAEAVAEFERALEQLDRQARTDDYVKVAERLLFLDPSKLEHARRLARLYLGRGDTKRALAKLQTCFKADPRHVETLRLLADAFRDLKQIPKTVSVLKELAKIYDERGADAERDQVWATVLQHAPDDGDARMVLGQARVAPPVQPMPAPSAPIDPIEKILAEVEFCLSYGMLHKAKEYIERLFRISPEHPVGLDRLRQVCERAGDLPGAAAALVRLAEQSRADRIRYRDLLDRARVLDPHNPTVVNVMGGPPRGTTPEAAPPRAPAQESSTYPAPAQPASAYRDLAHEASALQAPAPGALRAPAPGAASFRAPAQPAYLEDEPSGGEVFIVEEEVPEATYFSSPPEVELTAEEDFETLEPDELEEVEASGPYHPPPPVDDLLLEASGDALPSLADLGIEDESSPFERTLVMNPAASVGPSAPSSSASVGPSAPSSSASVGPSAPGSSARTAVTAPDRTVVSAPPPMRAPRTASALRAPARQPGRVRTDADVENELEEAEFFLHQGLLEEARVILVELARERPRRVDIATLLRDVEARLGPQAANFPAGDGAEAVALEDMFEDLSTAVGMPPARTEDCETHYDLGIAYKEMGLLDDAINEFTLAMRAPARELSSLERIGACLVEKGMHEQAILELKRGLVSPRLTEAAAIDFYYGMGAAYEGLGEDREALYYYRRVSAAAPGYRDVQQRIVRLAGSVGPSGPSSSERGESDATPLRRPG